MTLHEMITITDARDLPVHVSCNSKQPAPAHLRPGPPYERLLVANAVASSGSYYLNRTGRHAGAAAAAVAG